MRPIQYVLLALGALLLHLYFSRLRSLLWDRIIVLMLAAGVMVMVLDPDSTTTIANQVGVGRGVDLILYLTLFLLVYVTILMYSKIRNLEAKVTRLTRALAIDQATIPHADVLNMPKPQTPASYREAS